MRTEREIAEVLRKQEEALPQCATLEAWKIRVTRINAFRYCLGIDPIPVDFNRPYIERSTQTGLGTAAPPKTQLGLAPQRRA